MFYYSVTAVLLIGFVSIMLVFASQKLGLQSFRVVITASIGSIAVSLLYPVIYNLASTSGTLVEMKLSFINVLGISTIVSLALIFILSLIASMIIPDIIIEMLFARFTGHVEEIAGIDCVEKVALCEPVRAECNYMEEIFTKTIIKEQKETADFEDNEIKTVDNLEKAVDSEQNTDKMGIEMTDSSLELQTENLTLDECLDEAFRLKQSGDLEGAILSFMYALDKKPERDLVFWIVLDVCVLYKQLNQVELAKNILAAYMEKYSNLMSTAMREEIESNLSGGLQNEENSRNTGLAYN